jgi:hypothetical protein
VRERRLTSFPKDGQAGQAAVQASGATTGGKGADDVAAAMHDAAAAAAAASAAETVGAAAELPGAVVANPPLVAPMSVQLALAGRPASTGHEPVHDVAAAGAKERPPGHRGPSEDPLVVVGVEVPLGLAADVRYVQGARAERTDAAGALHRRRQRHVRRGGAAAGGGGGGHQRL